MWGIFVFITMFVLNMDNQTHKNLAIEAIISHYKKATELINQLADKYNVDLSTDPYFGKLRKQDIAGLCRGEIDDNWNYWFHGSGCEFQNTTTGQFLYVRINGGHYGIIDNYYLYQFIVTSDSLAHIALAFTTYTDFNLVLDELENDKLLVDIDDLGPKYKSLVLRYII